MNGAPKLPVDPDELRIPTDVTDESALRDIVWKWVGFPESLWPMAELLGLIITRMRHHSALVAPTRSEMVMAIPRPSRPNDSVLYGLTADCHTWSEDKWREVLTEIVDYGLSTR